MADPYVYSSHSTPTPSGVAYYPPEDQSRYPAYGHQQPYGNQEYHNPGPDQYNHVPESYQAIQSPNQTYAPQQSSYHLVPEPYGSTERSHTPTGQPDYLGPVNPTGNEHAQDRIPENAGYYNNHPAGQPGYTPSESPHRPAVYESEPDDSRHSGMAEQRSDTDTDTDRGMDRGLGGSLAGGVAGYYLGHKKEHGLLGAIGGALLGNFLEDKVKDSKNDDDSDNEHGHVVIAGTLMVGTLIVLIIATRGTAMRRTTEWN
ncbi:uncharacterized protein N7500_005608 [Penicillium coprophilum]|uniref:uncharacterized protein n=1 Tax=Penicillium coprophilum TaxID=36646 RepID=UPI00238B6FEA|nr:uncharacterized protein N7500_005608 [Penicillium coprophilum]KAJ5163778.1 hypothetical protein N7500_005608 [Penicillium coprophilum]